MHIRIHTAEGSRTYSSIEEMPEGTGKGFAAWMLMAGEHFLAIHDTVIEIIEGEKDPSSEDGAATSTP
ncbi:hypothetical protein [Chlorobium sp. N1]|uniref:hypothetical protein n=1 Tax=Chlorobium sp. N1 TaxID=2491138 RepID=UPI00103914BC|nr:hypothetical protein [Chlorobium sp. N1]TCD48470.1 hypothetical protein E0L29_00845 [Chlorobium sp. N1]